MKPYLLSAMVGGLTVFLGMYLFSPAGASAQSAPDYLYIEPDTTFIRDPNTGTQVQGKVMIDKRTGDIWGFPTATNAPYPVVQSSKEPPVSKPIHLGKFDLAAMRK